MLDSMRSLSKSIVSKLLMALLVISFGIWGVGDILQNSGTSYAAKIDGEIVSVADFQRQASTLQQQLESVGMKNIARPQIMASALKQLVQQRLNLREMRHLGLYTGDDLVAKNIATMPEFADKKTGKFSRETYTRLLKNNGLKEAQFIGEMKKDLATKFLADSLSMQGVSAPQSVATLEATLAGELRDVVIFTIPASDAMDETNAAALQKFYDDNKTTLYLTPEQRSFDYVVLTKTDLETLVKKAITEPMVEEAMAKAPELSRDLARLKLAAEQRDTVLRTLNNSIADALAAGTSLREALTQAGITAELRTAKNLTADAAKMSTDAITRTVAEQGFTLGAGEVSGLVTAKTGETLIVSVNTITPASPQAFEQVKADVKTRLGKQLAREAAHAKALGAKEALLANTQDWQAIARAKKLALRDMHNLPRPQVGKQPSAGLPAPLHQAIFERGVGEIAGPWASENGSQMLALITSARIPKTATLTAPEQRLLNDRLARDLEASAYQSFAQKYKVTINPAVIQTNTASGGAGE